MNDKNTLLGGLSPREFLARHWQKKPLLIRAAVPGFRNLTSVAALYDLAARDDCEARLIGREGRIWELEHGPFDPAVYSKLPPARWTLLVQGLNHFVPAADALLQRFDFIPRVRLDDVMVSYAVKGGGVGPHIDSYDVFLLQGEGRRRWRISSQRDIELDPRAPIRVMKNFRAEQEWVLEPGDMLYLPPGVAHDGVALDPCMTYSIGFRAPSAQELAVQFLGFMQERVALRGMYRDPDLQPQRGPAQIGDDYIRQAETMLDGIRWSRRDVEDFLGHYLSEPKAHVQFERPRRRMAVDAFARALARSGAHLARTSLMLYRGGRWYLNGEAIAAPPAWRATLRELADRRGLSPRSDLDADLLALMHEWYLAGWLLTGAQTPER
jgi:50S ribosomal protein L16 3-hydroxylase